MVERIAFDLQRGQPEQLQFLFLNSLISNTLQCPERPPLHSIRVIVLAKISAFAEFQSMARIECVFPELFSIFVDIVRSPPRYIYRLRIGKNIPSQ